MYRINFYTRGVDLELYRHLSKHAGRALVTTATRGGERPAREVDPRVLRYVIYSTVLLTEAVTHLMAGENNVLRDQRYGIIVL